MDLATIIGFLVGFGMIGWALWSGSGGSPETFWDAQSVMVVIGGALGATFLSFPLKNVISVIRVLKQAFFSRSLSPNELIQDIVGYAEIARRDGILSLEKHTAEIKDEFLVRGIQMAVDGSSPELIEQILSSELDAVIDRHSQGRKLFQALGTYGPAFGMIGTLIGLVIMLKNMDTPDKIGPGMATAILTTLYGAMLANMIALPIADKLQLRSDEELLLKNIVVRGLIAIQSGDNPRIVEQKLKTFLSADQRRKMNEETRQAA